MAKKILLIDPDVNLQGLLGTVFGSEDYELICATSLAEAYKLLADNHVDLIITEAFDQHDNNIEFDPSFLKDLKHCAAGIPIVLLTTYVERDHREAGTYGVDDVFMKPFDINELADRENALVGVAKKE